jgi:hypothetical protein
MSAAIRDVVPNIVTAAVVSLVATTNRMVDPMAVIDATLARENRTLRTTDAVVCIPAATSLKNALAPSTLPTKLTPAALVLIAMILLIVTPAVAIDAVTLRILA